jgi:hypothetical protein
MLDRTSAVALRTCGGSKAMTSTAIVASPNHSTVVEPRCSFHGGGDRFACDDVECHGVGHDRTLEAQTPRPPLALR